mmetsp:Transcript_28352/g.82140  ORF Transcript_28352/g.82140 Transcript_28352/m.82140 type:complete len:475 (+) Transcript_28352:65-1489(+)
MESSKLWVLLNGLMSYFLSIALVYQMSPFFPKYAMETAGASAGEVGVIFAVLPGAAFLAAVPAGEAIVRFGPKRMLTLGLFGVACSSLMFGLSSSTSAWLFWRAWQGISSAFINSSISCTFAKAFPGPQEFAYVNGLQKAVASLGFALAPMLGGVLFSLGGFFWPFGASAICHLVFVALSCFVPGGGAPTAAAIKEPLLEREAPQHVSVREIWYKDVMLLLPACILVPAFWGAFDPLIAGHLHAALGITDSETTGALMAIPAYPAAVLNAVVAAVMARLRPDSIALFGLLLLVVAELGLALTDPGSEVGMHFNLYPEPGSPQQWTWQITILLLCGMGASFTWSPPMPDMMQKAANRIADQRRLSHEAAVEAVSPAVATVFNGAAAIGEAAGPILGGVLYNVCGFSGTFLTMAFVFLAYCGFLLANRLLQRPAPAPSRPKLAGAGLSLERALHEAAATLGDMMAGDPEGSASSEP